MAARIPLGLVAIVMVVTNQVLVPVISTWLVKKTAQETWRLTSVLLTATLIIGGGLTLIAAVVAWPLMRLTAPGLSEGSVDLAASVSRVVFAIVPLVTMAEVLRALLNARRAVVAPAAMHVVMNGLAAGLIIGTNSEDIHVIAWAYLAGAAAQLAFMVVLAYRRGFRFRLGFAFRDPDVSTAGRLCVRPLLGASLNPLARVGEQLFVSFLPPGSVTILNYGYRLVSAIGGSILFRSVMVVVLPRLTQAAAMKDDPQVQDIVRLSVKVMLSIALPLTALMAVLARPAAIAVFRRGSFSEADAALLGLVVGVYAASVLGSGVQRSLLAPFMARLDTRTPLRNTIYGVITNLALVPLFVLPFGRQGGRAILGVAAAYSVAQYVNVAHAWNRLRRDLGIHLKGLRRTVFQATLASAMLAVVLVLGYRLLELGEPMPPLHLLARTAVVAMIALAFFGAVFSVLGLPEIRRLRAARGLSRPPPMGDRG